MRLIPAVLSLVLYILIFMPVLIILWLLRKKYPEQTAEVAYRMIKTYFKAVLFITGTKVIKEGLDNIPDEPVLYVSNHRSYFDILCTLVCTKRRAAYVAKSELGKAIFIAQWMVVLDCVFLKRGNIKEGLKAILATVEHIKRGTSMFIFPEGTRNSGENKDIPAEFREGSLKAAQKAGCKIVPVAVKNTETIFENQWPWIRKATVRVSFLKPCYITDIPADYKKTPALYTRMLIEEDLKRPL